MKELIDRIKGWSKKKKILAGIAVFFLFAMCMSAIADPPVDEESNTDGTVVKSDSPKPTSTPTDKDRIAAVNGGAIMSHVGGSTA